MRHSGFWFVVLVAVAIGLIAAMPQHSDENGRFELVETRSGGPTLVDTRDGRVWAWIEPAESAKLPLSDSASLAKDRVRGVWVEEPVLDTALKPALRTDSTSRSSFGR